MNYFLSRINRFSCTVLLCCISSHQDTLYYAQLKANVLLHDMLVDNLIYKVRVPFAMSEWCYVRSIVTIN